MAEKIPLEIVFDIFLRLDIESLFRARFVCKAWQYAIDDDPCFVTMYVDRAAKSPAAPLLISLSKSTTKSSHNPVTTLLFHAIEDGPRELTLKTSLVAEIAMQNNIARNFRVCGSCHGLICFESKDVVSVCNPLLKQVIILPIATMHSNLQSYGLGFDVKSSTYKIVHAIFEDQIRGEHPFREGSGVEIYTHGTNSWRRKIGEKPAYPLYKKPVFAHGSLHWMTDHKDHTDVIQSFDLAKEEFYVTSCPDFRHKYLIELRGALAIVDISSNTKIEIWAWKKNCSNGTEKWTKEYRIDMKAREMDYNAGVEFMGMWDNGEIVLKSSDGFFTYKPENDDFRCVNIPGITADDTKFIGFRGSLVSLSPYKFIHM